MPQLAFASTFWESYDALEKDVKAGVRKVMARFQQLTIHQLHGKKGVHLESVAQAKDSRIRTVRITDFWRGVVVAPDDGSEVFLLLIILPHDAAYDWAKKRRITVNTATLAVEVRNVVAIEQLTPALEKAASEAPALLFAKHSDTVLRDLGIDDQVRRAVRTIIDQTQLEAFATLLPEDQFEVLQYLAEGFTPEEVYRDVVAERRPMVDHVGEPSLEMAIVNTAGRITLVTGPDELADVLDKPFTAWRIFLHPSQRRVAYRPSFNGPAQVTGGPGTGKTVVALHRVKHLLSRSPDTRVLLTTYTNALAASLRENLALLLDDDDELLARADVTTVNAFAYRIVHELGGGVRNLINDADERQRWRKIIARQDLPWTEHFLVQEYRHVILAHRVETLEEYQSVSRRGRGSALGPRQREQVWQAVRIFLDDLRRTGDCTHLQVCHEAASLVDGHSPRSHGYDHVVVDEAQDLHPAQWRVLRAAVLEGPDDMFIVGDPHQRIYDSKVSLGTVGIHVTGRSNRLRVNYRSTAEILAWAAGVMADSPVEDLSGEGGDSLAGYRSLLRGSHPVATGHPTEQEEVSAVVERIKAWMDQGIPAREIAVSSRFNIVLDKAADRLAGAGIPVVKVKEHPHAMADGVRLATMHAMKGLEFRCVAVAGVTARAVPFAKEITPPEVDRLQHDSDLLRERCVLFVACTRAREALYVSWSGAPSPFVPS
uniref:UvrD-helicase domain-containing protein n=1 Tax=Herbidospora sakaeratensis TaxID=564415 RepID=UPI0007848547